MAASAQIKKVNQWHEQLCTWLLANPAAKQSEAAKLFNVTQSWLSTVINSDAFQDYYRERSAALAEGVTTGLIDKMKGAADQAVTEIQRRLESPLAMSTGELLEITDVMTKRVVGQASGAAQQPLQQILIVSKDDLAAARAAMRGRFEGRALSAPTLKEFDGEAVDVVSAGGDK